MKQITAVVHSEDAQEVSSALVAAGFSITQAATSGGFLRKGSTTLFAAVEDSDVDRALQIISQHCRTRTQMLPGEAATGMASDFIQSPPVEISVGGATVIVTPIDRFIKL